MGWLDKLKWKLKNTNTYAQMLSGYTPIFSQFGTDIYASDVIQQSIMCIVNEIKKLQPTHIIKCGNDVTPVNDSIQKVLDNPNEIMTTSEFIEKAVWMLFLNYNSFIVPCYDRIRKKDGTEKRIYRGLYPVQPTQVDFIQDATNALFVKLHFASGFETIVALSDIIHIKYKFSVNEFMGGNESGQPDNEALLKTLDLNHQLLTGLSKAMKASYAVNGIIKYKTLIDKGTTEKNLKELEKRIRNSESGFLPLDLSGDYIPLDKKIATVDDKTLKFIDEKILRNFGVSIPILTGDYTKSQYEAFYQKTLEPIIISLSQNFTKALFSERERALGHKIQFYPKDLIFMSVAETIEVARILGDRGSIYENEMRVAFGFKPLPELEGVRKQSLNYVDVSIANQYQLKGAESKNENEN